MSEILVRDLAPSVVDRLKQQARAHNRSLQGEVKAILEAQADLMSVSELVEVSADWHARLAGRAFDDSAELIRADRER